VKDGLRTKRPRGVIGATWWSQRFLEVLSRFHESGRLARGRSYARRGQVINLDVRPGRVDARVQGSRVQPYRVTIGVAAIDDADWARAEQGIAERAVFLARLLNGEMPDEIESVFAACQLSLFPARARDLSTSCSCPDWEPLCKHVAAVYYLLADRFDDDPFLIFAWRGRPRDRLLADLRALRGAAPAGQEPRVPRTPLSAVLGGGDEPLDALLDRYWGDPDAAGESWSNQRERPAVPTRSPAAILRELPASGLRLAGRPVEELLAPVYERLVAHAFDPDATSDKGSIPRPASERDG
jgi:uncharacterized Zn finger protein